MITANLKKAKTILAGEGSEPVLLTARLLGPQGNEYKLTAKILSENDCRVSLIGGRGGASFSLCSLSYLGNGQIFRPGVGWVRHAEIAKDIISNCAKKVMRSKSKKDKNSLFASELNKAFITGRFYSE